MCFGEETKKKKEKKSGKESGMMRSRRLRDACYQRRRRFEFFLKSWRTGGQAFCGFPVVGFFAF